MCFSLNDYESKASRHSNGLIYLKNREITFQKHIIDSHTKKVAQHKTKENIGFFMKDKARYYKDSIASKLIYQ